MKPQILILLGALIIPTESHACCSIKKFARALGDVASFGESGRQRDRERAERREREAQIHAENARREKETKRESLKSEKNIHEEVRNDLAQVVESLEFMSPMMSGIRKTAEQQFAQRSWYRNTFLPRLRSLWSDESEYSAAVLAALEQMNTIAAQESQIPPGMSPEAELASKRNILKLSKTMIQTLQQAANDQNLEVRQLLAIAMERLDNSSAQQLVEKLASTQLILESILVYAKERKFHSENKIASLEAQITALDKELSPPALPPPGTLQELRPIQLKVKRLKLFKFF